MKYYCLVFGFLAISSAVEVDKIVFPGDSHSPAGSETNNSDKRVPISGASKCPNEKYYYYPGDQENDWVCDCKPAYVYYPQNDDCFQVYRQGPCNRGQYLVLQKEKVIPECVRNPCKIDGEVMFNNNCEKLYTTGPCQESVAENLKSSVLDINETTLELQCIPASSVELTLIKVKYNNCPPGSKRVSEGQCRKIIPAKNNNT